MFSATLAVLFDETFDADRLSLATKTVVTKLSNRTVRLRNALARHGRFFTVAAAEY